MFARRFHAYYLLSMMLDTVVTLASAETDEDLVAQARTGSSRAFTALMQRHNRSVYRCVRGVLGSDAAEDVMQQAYLQAFTRLEQFAGTGSFRAWLTTIAIRHAFAVSAAARKMVPTEALDQQEAGMHCGRVASPDTEAQIAELRALIEQAVDRLPVSYRVPFLLREVEGQTISEVASALELTEEAAKVRVFRAKAMLRKQLDREFVVDGAFRFDAPRCVPFTRRVLAALAELTRAQGRASASG